jgi:WD40 repeat protein
LRELFVCYFSNLFVVNLATPVLAVVLIKIGATKMYLIGTRSDRIAIWDCESKQHLATLTSTCLYNPDVYSCSSDGRLLAVCSGNCHRVIVWDISDISDCKELPELTVSISAVVVYSLCFVPNSERLIIGYQNEIALVDVGSGTLLHTALAEGRRLVSVHWFNDGIISVSCDGTVQGWDVNLTANWQQKLGPYFIRGYTARSGKCMALVPHSVPGSIFLLDFVTMQVRQAFKGLPPFGRLQMSMDGSRILVSLSYDPKELVLDVVREVVMFEFFTFGGVCFSPDEVCVYGTSPDGTIFALDAETGSSLPLSFPSCSVPCCNLSVHDIAGVVLM